jgi:hypothetical protein
MLDQKKKKRQQGENKVRKLEIENQQRKNSNPPNIAKKPIELSARHLVC